MRFARIGAALVAGASLLSAAGCQNKVHDENLQLHQQNRELETQVNDRDERLKAAPDPAQLAAMQREIADRDAKIQQLQASLTSGGPGGTPDPSLQGIETTFDRKAGTITVNLPGDVLFDSGKATLKPSALSTLDKVASAIKKDYSGKTVKVNGYTDADPISKTKDQWDDNWDLSYARAKSVMQYLISRGVDTRLVSLSANGANKPKASKSASRRVEIVVFAK